MIANTLLPLAQLLDNSALIGEQCFLFERCEIDFKELEENILKLRDKDKNLKIPIIFFGKEIKSAVSGFAGSGKANASKGTFQKKGIKYPTEIFCHKESDFKTYNVTTLCKTLNYIQNLSDQELGRLFSLSLQPFSFKNEPDLQNAVIKSVCLPVTARAPSVIIHGLLVLNAVNQHSSLINVDEYKNLLPVEILRFILLFWFINSLPDKVFEYESKRYTLTPSIAIGGNLAGADGLLEKPMLVSLGNNEVFGEKSSTENKILNYVKSLTCDDNADTIKISGRSYTAPKTGIAPTSSYIDQEKKENALMPLVRNGGDNKEMIKHLDNYTALISGTNFYLGQDSYFYIFPETDNKHLLEMYLKAVKKHCTDIAGFWVKYNKVKNTKNDDKKNAILTHITESRKRFWLELVLSMNIDKLMFVFEKKIGQKAGEFFSWTRVYKHLDAAKTFLFVYHIDGHELFSPLNNALKMTGHNLAVSWATGEKERLIDFFMNKQSINWLQQWQRWRKFFLRSDLNENPFDSKSWEGAFYFIMLVNEILNFSVPKGEDGDYVLQKFQKKMEVKMGTNQEQITEYLNEVFHSDDENVRNAIIRKAKDYSRFVDTSAETKKWKSVLDGLICGWALKSVCRKLRPDSDDYKKLLGGRSLSKMLPTEINEKIIALREKVNRQDSDAWNIDAPMEKLLWYCQQNANSENIHLFSDALALGFMRFDD